MALKKQAVKPITEAGEVAPESVVEAEVVEKKIKKKAPVPVQEEKIEIEIEPTPKTTQEVVKKPVQSNPVVQETTVIAESANAQIATVKGGVLSEAEEQGFSGLSIGFGSFPILKIENGAFDLDGEELEEKSIHLNIMQSRSKFMIKQKDQGDDAEFVYTYDKVTDASGSPVADFVTRQQAEGFQLETKEYAEAVAEILEEGEYEGEYCILSIPPSGKSRFSGYVASLGMKRRCTPKDVITVAKIGKKIVKEGKSWNPWNFKFHSMID